jgi:signal transduction histidine kinase/ligand-binding sensor domain-containing protein/DNA-binding response OmpR family regulator
MLKQHKILIVLLFIPVFLSAQYEDIKFEQITIQDGLSDNRVFSIVQDHKGFIWFGTYDGLNRYDGYKFKIYRNNPNNSSGLGNNWIQALYEDHLGNLWVGTGSDGLYRYDRNRDTFIRYGYEKDNPNSLCGNQIEKIFETDQHVLWIGCGNGLNKYSRESDNFTRYYPDDKKMDFEINIDFIGAITQDSYGQLWIATWNQGLFFYDAKKDKFVKYKLNPKYSKTFIDQFPSKLIGSQIDGKAFLWFSSHEYGLYKINIDNGEINHYKHLPNNLSSISENRIRTMFIADKESKEIWLGTDNGGLNILDLATEEFTHFKNQPENQWSLNDNIVWSIYKDKSGLMWVGTAQGVNICEPNSSKFKKVQQYTELPKDISLRVVWTIHESILGGDRSMLWLGTENGLYSFERTGGKYKRYKHNPENIKTISDNGISKIIQPQYGNRNQLWIGTMNGLNKFDLNTKQFTRYYIPTKDPVYNMIFTICEDKKGIIWIGTRSPYLYSFDPEIEQFTRHQSHYGLIRSLYIDSSGMIWIGAGSGFYKYNPESKNEKHYRNIAGILNIFEDKNGILWLCTSNGLNRFDRFSETFTVFSEKEGLISKVVRAILEDGQGNLWMSTDKGIAKFSPDSKEFRNFDSGDGLHGDKFWGAFHINYQGEMFFGGRNGITYFHPDSIKEKNYFPPIVFTDFQVFNKSVIPGKNSALKNEISEVKEITLSHEQSVFSIEFAVLEYHHPDKIKYAYIMENVDLDWVYTDASRRFATYTNLDPGEYTFKIKASNKDGKWNENGKSIAITILPPWWATTFAYIVYGIILVLSIYAIREYEMRRIRLKHNLEIKEQETEKLEIINAEKSRFFAGISHEFRTPLTLILGPVERLIQKIKDKTQSDDLKRIRDNARRMNKLVDMYLDLSMLESDALTIRTNNEDIIPILRILIASFESLAADKKISLQFINKFESIICAIDKEKFEQIIINLVNNAIKFTPAQGKIQIQLLPDDSKKNIVIKISDTGIGIAEDQKDKIFEMFYQVNNDINKRLSGTGIGLAMVKELVNLHDADISVKSKLSHGTEFHLQFPIIEINDGKTKKTPEDSLLQEQVSEEVYIDKMETDERVRILVVEDNHEMRKYIKSLIENKFKVETCNDGSEGINCAVEFLPDLIVSDVMMPNMDGYEFVDKIKNDLRTSHVPVILLTAKTKKPDKLKGLKTGADAYITKPFDPNELYICVDNLLENRKRIHQKFKQDKFFNPSEIDITSADEKFLQQCHQAVEENIANPDFTMENFASQVNLSRTQLHKKLKSLTDHSATEYVKTIRLKKAAILLESGFGNITEIAYETGFSNPSYFAECFKKFYKTSPLKYAQSGKS